MKDKNTLGGSSENRIVKDSIHPSDRKTQYTNVDEVKLSQRQQGEDFEGNLTEFQLSFQWRWLTADERILYEREAPAPYTGTITIQDDRLDPSTYPGQSQVITLKDGRIDFYDSLEGTKAQERKEAEKAYATMQAQLESGINSH